jgi:N-acetylneuraminate lyase
MSFRLTGLVAAPYTPFGADGEVNVAVIPSYAEHLLRSGVNGVFLCGSTGEGLSLSVAERLAVAEAWVKVAQGRFPVVVHVGHNSLPEARALAAHAEWAGADAIAAVPPSYYKPPTVAALADFCARVAEAAPRLPFYYYHIPSMTGVTLPVPEVLRQVAKRAPNFRGVKFSHSDLMELQECLALREFDVVFGYDEMLLAGLALGCKGAVGSTYNFAAPLYRRVIDAFSAGDLETARREQLKSVRLVRTLYDFGLMRAGKAALAFAGIDCGPVRPPLTPLAAEEFATLRERLDDIRC